MSFGTNALLLECFGARFLLKSS